jgi:hypothetical protein
VPLSLFLAQEFDELHGRLYQFDRSRCRPTKTLEQDLHCLWSVEEFLSKSAITSPPRRSATKPEAPIGMSFRFSRFAISNSCRTPSASTIELPLTLLPITKIASPACDKSSAR